MIIADALLNNGPHYIDIQRACELSIHFNSHPEATEIDHIASRLVDLLKSARNREPYTYEVSDRPDDTPISEIARIICAALLEATEAHGLGSCPLCTM